MPLVGGKAQVLPAIANTEHVTINAVVIRVDFFMLITPVYWLDIMAI
jgi:hypothetical protein